MVATIRDVARRAEVHPGTASRALNEATRSLVKAETADAGVGRRRRPGLQAQLLGPKFQNQEDVLGRGRHPRHQ